MIHHIFSFILGGFIIGCVFFGVFWLLDAVETVKEKVEMATRYADMPTEYFLEDNFSLDVQKGIEEYDEHYEAMINIFYESNGQYAFNAYIEDICGWKLKDLVVDFKYEW